MATKPSGHVTEEHLHVLSFTDELNLCQAGVVYCKDTLPETAFIKLAWLLGNYKDKEEVKRLLSTDLRGEINERLQPDEYLE